jgi:hypothetical protein
VRPGVQLTVGRIHRQAVHVLQGHLIPAGIGSVVTAATRHGEHADDSSGQETGASTASGRYEASRGAAGGTGGRQHELSEAQQNLTGSY